MNSMVSLNERYLSLVVPKGNGAVEPIMVDISPVSNALRRVPEIQRVTTANAGELMSIFTSAMTNASRAMSLVELELLSSKRNLKIVRAISILDRVESVLAERKIKSTADTREAALDLDPDVAQAQERLDILTVLSTELYNNYTELKEALYSTKKALDASLQTPYGT